MPKLLIQHADVLVTMDDQRREITDGGMVIEDGWIRAVSSTSDLPTIDESDATLLDLRGHIVIPGLVNTHHHMYQSLTRAIPAAQNAVLFDWLVTLYPIWARLDSEAVYTSSLTAMAELLLSGCTTSSDHLYLFPNGARLDDQIRAAQQIGLRFHAARGSMSLGESQGGLPPDSVCDSEDTILRDCQRLIETYHDPKPGAMLRVVLAPCSPFSVTSDLMRETVTLARQYQNVHMHTHLAETLDEEKFCLEMFGKRPLDYMESLGWVGNDVWFAHCVHISGSEIQTLAHTGCGVAHCPSSNMRLGAGIAPVPQYRTAGVRLGLGVDGSASNDGAHMLGEARLAMLLARVNGNPAALSAREALELGTLGGAAVLGRDDIGSLAAGKCADFIAFRQDTLDFAGGAVHDPLAALLFCAPAKPDLVVVNGRIVVRDGILQTADMGPVIERHNKIARTMVDG